MIQKLVTDHALSDYELAMLLETNRYDSLLFEAANSVRRQLYGTDVYIRGLIEFSNYCANNCHYCGIRAGNQNIKRYRLDKEDILLCCKEGYSLGFRTFVLQSGEDLFYTDDMICEIISDIKRTYHDCAVTLSLGEKEYTSYKRFHEAGADRYLLRHEAANERLYRMLHPNSMSLEKRKECLYALKTIGYQVGSGFMVGTPFQTTEHLIEDIRFLQKLSPDMIGIGPYITHKDTPFDNYVNGDLNLCLRLIAIIRLLFPRALIPATTALGTISSQGREQALLAGANVIMPNLSPVKVRKLYQLYDNKICTGEEAAECRNCLEQRVSRIGYKVVSARGDVIKENNMKLKEKHTKLKAYLQKLGNIAIAFSGGVDSTFLLKTAHDILGDHVIAITARSCSFPERELREAADFCAKEGIRHIICDSEELDIEGFSQNPINRCYLCKNELFTKIWAVAQEQGISHVAEGSNIDDNGDYRPGLIAVNEQGVKSPLRVAELTKQEIRILSKEMDLPTWNKQSFACLSSRFPYGETITAERLAMIDKSEQILIDAGFRQVRVRYHNDMARIETDDEGFLLLMNKDLREEIHNEFKQIGFTYVSLDLLGYRTGSMNETIK